MSPSVSPDTGVRHVDLLHGACGCTRSAICDKFTGQFRRRMVGRYVGEGEVFRGQKQSAVIDLRGFDFDAYMAAVRKVHKGNAVRDAKKADRAGFVCKRFVWRNFIPDIVEINRSKDVRSGGRMNAAYHRGVEEMGGAPTKLAPLGDPACPVHCSYCWGIFEPKPGHQQGDIVTDERLLAYIRLKRQGSLGIYSTILGHGDYLRLGVMYRLHYAVMQWIAQESHGPLHGLDWLMYGAVESGAAGLQMWKKRCLFQGAYLVLGEDVSRSDSDRPA